MSLYRTIIAAVAALGLGFATSALAADDATLTNGSGDTKAMQTADANNTSNANNMSNMSSDQNNQTQNMAQASDTKVNVNTANAKELMKVKGLSSSKAKSIIAYRKKHGDFKSLDELKDIKGFKKLSDEQMKKITDQLTV